MNRRQLLKYGAFGLGAMAIPPALAQRSPTAAQPQADLSAVERIVIHPAIGVARVGNSPDDWFLGPETPGPHPVPPGGFKDAAGRLKPQAARFRLYGLDANDQVVAEVTADDADITWTVHLANTKAAWYTFDIALDIPQAKGLPAAPLQPAPDPQISPRRNLVITERESLRIDPGPRSIGGVNANADGTDPAAASTTASSSASTSPSASCAPMSPAASSSLAAMVNPPRPFPAPSPSPSPTTISGTTTSATVRSTPPSRSTAARSR